MTDLADEVRGLLADLVSLELTDDARSDAQAKVAALRAELDGRTRLRWYEGGERTDDLALFNGRSNAMAAPMRLAKGTCRNGEPGLIGRVTLGRLYEGPPRGVHGGYVAGLFDDICGGVQRVVGGPLALTGRLQIRYRNLTPLDTEIIFEAWPEEVRGRRIVVKAASFVADTRTAEAEALFVRVKVDDAGRVT